MDVNDRNSGPPPKADEGAAQRLCDSSFSEKDPSFYAGHADPSDTKQDLSGRKKQGL